MEYTVVTTSGRDDLLEEVRKWIDCGWEPQGGVSMVRHGSCPIRLEYTQAMVRQETNPDSKVKPVNARQWMVLNGLSIGGIVRIKNIGPGSVEHENELGVISAYDQDADGCDIGVVFPNERRWYGFDWLVAEPEKPEVRFGNPDTSSSEPA